MRRLDVAEKKINDQSKTIRTLQGANVRYETQYTTTKNDHAELSSRVNAVEATNKEVKTLAEGIEKKVEDINTNFSGRVEAQVNTIIKDKELASKTEIADLIRESANNTDAMLKILLQNTGLSLPSSAGGSDGGNAKRSRSKNRLSSKQKKQAVKVTQNEASLRKTKTTNDKDEIMNGGEDDTTDDDDEEAELMTDVGNEINDNEDEYLSQTSE